MKVIFLDIDGVLNCDYCKTKIDGYFFVMDDKIELLREIIEQTDAKIVLISTWRRGWFDLERGIESRDQRHFVALRDKLQEFGIELMSYTPFRQHGRGLEIEAWFEMWTGEAVERYVILDDMDGKFLRPHSRWLVRTSFAKGLTQKHVRLAVKILLSEEGKS